MTDNITPLRPGPALNDIPGMLRQLADQFEAGEYDATSLLVVMPQEGDWPILFGYGEHMGDLTNIATMELAKLWFANNLSGRSA